MLQHSVASTRKTSRTRRLIDGIRASLSYRLHRLRTPTGKPLSSSILHNLSEGDADFRHMSFTFAIVAISARIACADGALTREKYLAFRESFPLKSSICGKIRSLFTLACSDQTPLDHYVTQIKYSYPDKRELYTSIVGHLFRIASADGMLSRDTEHLLASVSHGLDIPPAAYNELHARYTGGTQAHKILGVSAHAKPQTLKKRYHELMRSYHPDRFSGHDLSPELESLLKLKASEINAAYRALSKRAA